MSRTTIRYYLSCLGALLFAFGAVAQQPPPAAAPAATPDFVALDPQHRDDWMVQSGDWEFGNNYLRGDGNSALDLKGPFKPPFTLDFHIKVISGMRPRVKVGSVYFANEGYKRHFQLDGRDPVVEYELNREYAISMAVREDGVDLSIDGKKVLNLSKAVGPIPVITFRSGDGWSKGTTHFSDIIIRHPAQPNAPVAPVALAAATVPDHLKEASGSLVFINGNNGSGSGFIANVKGSKVLFTNLHVLAEVHNSNMTLLDRSQLKLGFAEAAVDHDVGAIAVACDAKGLEFMPHMEKNASIGDDVVVLGNAEGAGVINPIHGKLVGIGPNLVEVDAPFVPGNSGSPIIHVATGQVLGIATYATFRKADDLNKDSSIKRLRRFGYRIDSVTKWQPIQWPQFLAETERMEKARELTDDLIGLWNDFAKHKRINLDLHPNPLIWTPLNEFLNKVHARNASPGKVEAAQDAFIQALVDLNEADLNEVKRKITYDYFQRSLAEETKVREELVGGLAARIRDPKLVLHEFPQVH